MRLHWSVLLGMLILPVLAAVARADPRDIVTYAGGPGPQEFVTAFELSDGTLLVSGNARDLNWIPAGVPRTALPAGGISSADSGKVTYILHLSHDLQHILQVVYLPKGLINDIRCIKTNAAPGKKTGDLYISGPRVHGDPKIDGGDVGYFIAKLNGNFLNRVPTGFSWEYNVAAVGSLILDQPWDVTSDGRVYLVAGEPFSRNPDAWSAVYCLDAHGHLAPVERWRYHLTDRGPWWGEPASKGKDVRYSVISLGTRGKGSLRSWTAEDYHVEQPDGNGGKRRGRWPLDAFFAGPFDPHHPMESSQGPGYTGYRLGPANTCAAQGLVVDRRTNDLYLGLSIQSRLPNDQLDVEPAVVAFNADGSLKWWSRLYTESKANSPSQQFVTALAVDYSQPADRAALVVQARCFGNAPHNLWRGDRVKAPGNPGRSFESFFDGTSDQFFIGWLGRLTLENGTLLNATYVGEYAEGLGRWDTQDAYKDPNLDGWLDHDRNRGDVGLTRLRPVVQVDGQGRIYILGSGQRTITTANAYQKMLKPWEGLSVWAEFARVYSPDLTTLVYSTILTGKWNPTNGVGANNTALTGILPLPRGLLVAGFHTVDQDGIIEGNAIPTQNVPPWGRRTPAGEEAILARFYFAK